MKTTRFILAGMSIASLLAFVYTALARMAYPFELEWMEGGSLDHVHRILQGMKLYVSPSLDFIPYLYTPLYFYVSAAFAWIFGESFLTLRLVSVLSTLGSLVVIHRFVRRETGEALFGLLAAGLFAASFKLSGYWFDLARVDSLFLLFLLLGFYQIRFGRSKSSAWLAGLFFTLAFLTKQLGLVLILPIVLYTIIYRKPSPLIFITTLVVGIGLSTLLLDRLHDGWFIYYIFKLQMRQPILPERLLSFWVKDLAIPLGIAGLAGLVFLYRQFLENRPNFWFYLLAAGGILGGTWSSRIHPGNYQNVLMPVHALIAILCGSGLYYLIAFSQKKRIPLLQYSVLILLALQFGAMGYRPDRHIPGSEELQAGQAVIQKLRTIGGDVYVPAHGYLAALAGKQYHAHLMSVNDVLFRRDDPIARRLLGEVEESFRSRKFSAIVMDADLSKITRDRGDDPLLASLERYYDRGEPVFSDNLHFWPLAGKLTRPEMIYIPKAADEP